MLKDAAAEQAAPPPRIGKIKEVWSDDILYHSDVYQVQQWSIMQPTDKYAALALAMCKTIIRGVDFIKGLTIN